MSFHQSPVSRRTVAKGAAWSVPAVAVAATAPTLAASPVSAPDLSTSVSAGAARDGDTITIQPSTIVNTGDVAAEGLTIVFEATAAITNLQLGVFGSAMDPSNLGITVDGLGTGNVTMNVPAGTSLGQVHIEPGDSYESPATQILSFADGTGDIELTVTVTATNGGVPFTPPTESYPAA